MTDLNLRDLDRGAMTRALAPHGVPAEVATRVFAAVQGRGECDLGRVRGLAATARRSLERVAIWPELPVVDRRAAADGFVKYLFRLPDGHEVEAVRIPLPDPAAARALKERRRRGEAAGLEALPTAKYTVCLSSQAGCGLACDFCATGRLGPIRSLETWEILAQVRAVASEAPHPVRGAVFMGMGEPFLAYDNVLGAAAVLSDPAGFAISAKAISISTAGVVPMIRRYTLPEIGAVWTDAARFEHMLRVEIAVTRAQAARGLVPPDALEAIEARARVDVARIAEIERTTDHDVIAFVSNVAENVGPEGRWLHYGLTSNDVVDTAQALLLRDASRLIERGLENLAETLKRRAIEYQHTPQVGRTHGVHAEPTTFGLKLALWVDEVRRQSARLEAAAREVAIQIPETNERPPVPAGRRYLEHQVEVKLRQVDLQSLARFLARLENGRRLMVIGRMNDKRRFSEGDKLDVDLTASAYERAKEERRKPIPARKTKA
jgi:adenine C2-methylase RlmN of 23S rRNA A2503 and tRNA A37